MELLFFTPSRVCFCLCVCLITGDCKCYKARLTSSLCMHVIALVAEVWQQVCWVIVMYTCKRNKRHVTHVKMQKSITPQSCTGNDRVFALLITDTVFRIIFFGAYLLPKQTLNQQVGRPHRYLNRWGVFLLFGAYFLSPVSVKQLVSIAQKSAAAGLIILV